MEAGGIESHRRHQSETPVRTKHNDLIHVRMSYKVCDRLAKALLIGIALAIPVAYDAQWWRQDRVV